MLMRLIKSNSLNDNGDGSSSTGVRSLQFFVCRITPKVYWKNLDHGSKIIFLFLSAKLVDEDVKPPLTAHSRLAYDNACGIGAR